MLALRIEGQLYPVEGSPTLPIGFTLEKLTEPQRQRNGAQIECNILRTPASEQLFGTAKDMHAAERFNESHHTATLVVDGAELMEGTLYLIETLAADSERAPYRVMLRSGGAEWAKQASHETLADVDIEWSMPLTLPAIAESWSLLSPVRYLPFVDVAEAAQRSIYDPFRVMLADNFHPFISLRRAIEHIFAKSGYSVESRFLDSDICRELVVSGNYGTSLSTAEEQAKMGFCSGRQSRVTATADTLGRVVASVGVLQHSVGNIVETADPTLIDDEGRTMSDTFNTADTFGIDDEGYARFKARASATVGFRLHLHYITDYRIKSRHRLTGFDRIEALPSSEARFEIANRFEDLRESLVGEMAYNLCVFDFNNVGAYNFSVSDRKSGAIIYERLITERYTAFSLPRVDTQLFATLVPVGGAAESDWAIYGGYVGERGTTEVEVDIRIAPQNFAKDDTFRFNEIWFGGAEPGMALTLLSDCRLSPYFDSKAGYGSMVTYEDITRGKVWLIELYESLCQMFNLVTITDPYLRRVYIETMDEFYAEGELVDWSDRIDYGAPIRISDAAIGLAEHLRYCYRGGDAAVEAYNAEEGCELGTWRATIPLYGTVAAVEEHQNTLFSPTVSRRNMVATAPSAYVPVMEQTAATDAPLRILRYLGMRLLPTGEHWAGSALEGYYPLGAFIFPGDGTTGGFTLGYEAASEKIDGLAAYHRSAVNRRAKGRLVTMNLRLRAADIENLFKLEALMPSIRSTFRFTINGESSLYRLVRLESFNAASPSTECTFITVQ